MNAIEALRSNPSFKTLAGEIAKSECAIFVGAGFSIGAGLPSWSQLETTMREKAGLSRSYSAPRTADCCRVVIGEHNFNTLIRKQIALDTRPSEVHRRIAGLPVNIFVTTNYDTLLEQALDDQKRPYKVLSLCDNAEWVQIEDSPSECLILKIHGCISRTPNKLIITEDDYLSFPDEHKDLETGLSSVIAKRPILFVGYSFSDWNLLSILHNVQRMTIRNRTNKYYLGVDLEPSIQKFLERRHELYVFNISTGTTKELAVLNFLDEVVEQFDIPQWFKKIMLDLGGNKRLQEIDRTTPLEALSPVFDAVTRMRLAMKIEEHVGMQLPIDRVMHQRTVGGLVDLVRECKEAKSAAV